MATRTAGRRSAAPPIRRRPAGERLLAEVWRGFADPARLGWSAGFAALGFVAVGILSRPEVRGAVETAARQGPLAHRLYSFLELDAPLSSWWLTVLVAVFALCFVATIVERAGDLALLLNRGRRTPASPAGSTVASARRAAAALGDGLAVGVGDDTLVLSRLARPLRAGVAVLCLAAVVAVAAMVVERTDGVAGEALVTPGETTDRVQLPGPLGTTVDKPLGFALSPVEFGHGGPAVKLEVLGGPENGRHITITPGHPADVGLTHLTGRANRPVAGGETFALTVVDEKTGRSHPVTADTGDAFPADPARPNASPQLEVLGWTANFQGLGKAVRMQSVTPDGHRDAFWVFEESPEFDAKDRAKRYALRLDSVSRRHETILGVTRHPGEPVGLGAAGLALLGLGLCLAGARESVVVRVRHREVEGTPASDKAVKAAVKAAGRGRKA